MKAVPINITSPDPSDCATTKAQRTTWIVQLDLCPQGGEQSSRTVKPKPSQRLHEHSKDRSVALTKQFCVK